MNSDFKVAIIIGLIILLLFWIFTLAFLLLRKPEKSKLIKKLFIRSFFLFFLSFIFLIIFS